jgi:hypothetical protein
MRLRFESRIPRRGAVAPLTVLSLAVFMGMVALVIDGGRLQEERRHAQATADAAALAAAADLLANFNSNGGTDSSGTARASALATAAANGYTNDGTNSVVKVNLSPQNYQGGPNAGQALPPGYVEVIVQFNEPRTFSNVFGSGAVPVSARAVARGQWGVIGDAITLLSLHQSRALDITGSGSVAASGPLRVNSDASDAIGVTGSGSATATQYNLVGGYSKTGSGDIAGPEGAAATFNSVQAIPDPLRYLPAPDPLALGLTSQGKNLCISGSQSVDLYPGIYAGGISISGSGSATLHANADGSPGIYYLEGGGLSITGSGSVRTAASETAGVMIYNDWGTCGCGSGAISLAGSGSLSLQPPASGPYRGISIFQARGSSTNSGPTITITGSGAMSLYGTVYAAYAGVRLTGSGGNDVMGGQYVVDSLTVTGSGTATVDPGNLPVARMRLFGLVE